MRALPGLRSTYEPAMQFAATATAASQELPIRGVDGCRISGTVDGL